MIKRTKLPASKAIIMLIVCLLMAIASCNRVNNEKIKVGYIPIADCSQVFIAYEKGFFKDEGLDVSLMEFQGGPQILNALNGKSIDIGFSNLISLINANAQGINLRAITGGPVEDSTHIENAIMALKSSKITNAKDLEDKTVAVNARKNIIELMLREYAAKNGANPDKINVVEFKFPQMQIALTAGKIDAMAIIEPYVTIAKKDPNIHIVSNYFTDVLPRTEISSYHADLKWINENKSTIMKFQDAINTATRYCNENPLEVRKVLLKYAKGDKKVLMEAVLPNFTSQLSSDNLQILIEKMQKNKWLTTDVQAKSLIYK